MTGANREILVIPQIESKEAVANVDAILSVPGVDIAFVGTCLCCKTSCSIEGILTLLVFLGPTDLHLSLGLAPSAEGREPIFIEVGLARSANCWI